MLYPDNTEQAAIEELVRRRSWKLGFGGTLETSYDNDHRNRAVQAFQHSSVFILLLYVLLLSLIHI